MIFATLDVLVSLLGCQIWDEFCILSVFRLDFSKFCEQFWEKSISLLLCDRMEDCVELDVLWQET